MADSENPASADGDQPIKASWKVNIDRLTQLQMKIDNPPRLLSGSAGRSSCCIFTVPPTLVEINGRSYRPQNLSVGPHHHNEPNLATIQEHKWRFLGTLLKRTQPELGLGLEDLLRAVHPLEPRARECYASAFHISTDDFAEMMVLDGCFIIELLRKFEGVVGFEPDDPLISLSWLSFFSRDMIKLENQMPFFILECLFDLTKSPGDKPGPTLSRLILNFFNNSLQIPEETVNQLQNQKGKHLLDLLRLSFIPSEPKLIKNTDTDLIPCITKLRQAGIKLRRGKIGESFLVVKFKHGVIEMPMIPMDDFMSCFLLNCVAYEQCHRDCSKHMTAYATFLDCLVNTSKDVEYLCDKNIVENYLGADLEVARFINNLGKDVAFDVNLCYLSGLFSDVNNHYKSRWHVQWAGFKYTYFNTPWSFISALAAFVLLVLTVLQTCYTIVSYLHPRS